MMGPGSGIGAADPANPFLTEIAEQVGLPAQVWTASGTHTARGYTSAAAQTTSVEGMRADCDNINLNKKLSTDFLSGVFGPGLIGFFYKCENISADTNKYWFTIAAADPGADRQAVRPGDDLSAGLRPAARHLLDRRTVHLHRPHESVTARRPGCGSAKMDPRHPAPPAP